MFKFSKTLILATGLSLIMPAFANIDSQDALKNFQMQEGYSEITQDQAHLLIQNDKVVIIDVRTKEEFDKGHIPNAINIPLESITDTTVIENVAKDKPVALYCRSGRRATEAGNRLVKAGYKNVMNFGGISTWKYEIVQ